MKLNQKLKLTLDEKMHAYLKAARLNPKDKKELHKEFAPSIQLQVHLKGKKIIHLTYGPKFKYFDLASLTKIIFTASFLMELVDQKKIDLDTPLHHALDWWPYKKMKLWQVLSHSAGLTWWAPFYRTWLLNKKNLKSKKYLTREQIKKILLKTHVDESSQKNKKSMYSDLDIILVGFLIEEVTGLSLEEAWARSKVHRAISTFHFNLQNKPKFKRSLYAPTERCPWRKKIVQGEVHDDNTWSFGGVSTHAGLFGTSDSLAQFGLMLRRSFYGEESTQKTKEGRQQTVIADQKTVRRFVKRAIDPKCGDWALSFMLPTKGGASCGRYFDLKSFGHTGFTGTSLWFDPKKDLLITILSNRVHPTRKNNHFVKLRPLLHDGIVEVLKREKLL